MEIIVTENTICTYQRQGNDKNGNPIYLINIFQNYDNNNWQNVNYCKFYKKKRLDKYNNIRMQSYSIEADCKKLIESSVQTAARAATACRQPLEPPQRADHFVQNAQNYPIFLCNI